MNTELSLAVLNTSAVTPYYKDMTYTNHVSIFEYDDYQEALKDLIEVRKNIGLPFSYRWFSMKAGFTSPNYLHLILDRKRHLSIEAIEKVLTIFGLKGKEAEYFRLLVHFNKAKTPTERAEIGKQMLKIRSQANLKYLKTAQMDYYLSWKNIAVRECLLLNKDGLTASELCDLILPKQTLDEIQECLNNLADLDLIEIKSEGRWQAREVSISSGDRVDSSALVAYHLQMIELAKESLDRFSGEDRDISNVSVPVSKENFEKIRKMIQGLRVEALSLSRNDSNPDRVAHLNLQLFPLALKKKESL